MSIIDEIYDAYPRHVARAAALTAIAKAIKKVDAAELLAAVRDFTAAKTKTDPKYIPHCATWMNQERWTDDRRDWGPSSQTDQYAGLRDFVADEGGAS